MSSKVNDTAQVAKICLHFFKKALGKKKKSLPWLDEENKDHWLNAQEVEESPSSYSKSSTVSDQEAKTFIGGPVPINMLEPSIPPVPTLLIYTVNGPSRVMWGLLAVSAERTMDRRSRVEAGGEDEPETRSAASYFVKRQKDSPETKPNSRVILITWVSCREAGVRLDHSLPIHSPPPALVLPAPLS
ncbi:hypothetical protein EDD15DRAFT_2191305 [Pisolithus albus]|nr:hypothetical protein EDD15DRAFT_2191305 [Pisolithus albus]